MLLIRNIISTKSSVHKVLTLLRREIEWKNIWRPKEDIQFIFLCGANIQKNLISKRRQQLIDFSVKNLPHTKFFIAESFFKILDAEGDKGNVLDPETELLKLADFIIMLLESESTFCELGAFASFPHLRDKIIVINDTQHRTSSSFINRGPIKAIEEVSGDRNILLYPMSDDGKLRGDGIGAVYTKLYEILHREPTVKRTRISEFDPNTYLTKNSIRFVHDIIFFACPIYLSEFEEIIKILFDKFNKKSIRDHLGFLAATEQITRSDTGLYKTTSRTPYFEYDFDINNILASFKNMYLRYDNDRLT